MTWIREWPVTSNELLFFYLQQQWERKIPSFFNLTLIPIQNLRAMQIDIRLITITNILSTVVSHGYAVKLSHGPTASWDLIFIAVSSRENGNSV